MNSIILIYFDDLMILYMNIQLHLRIYGIFSFDR